MRDIKFRFWIKDKRYDKPEFKMLYPDGKEWWVIDAFTGEPQKGDGGSCTNSPEDYIVMQYTGLTDRNKVEIYEGDIHRQEIEHDEGDHTYYFVCTWIKEWTMFAWLSITDGEYQKYLDEGAEALDTTMYWTYPTGESSDIIVCGNIYQNPDLLEK